MSNFKEKAQVFIIGLSVGLLIAGTFFILKLDDYFKELNLYKKVSQTFSLPVKQDIPENKAEAYPLEKDKKNSGKELKNKSALPADSSAIIAADKVSGLKNDTAKMFRNDSVNSSFASSDDIVVRKDELLAAKTLEVYNLNPTAAKISSKDSLLSKVSGIKDDKALSKQMFNVELWSSPLNYKGYKMSKYKMVLYGVQPNDDIKLYKADDVIYLKTSSFVYRLDYASDFKQYERITDEVIINKLK